MITHRWKHGKIACIGVLLILFGCRGDSGVTGKAGTLVAETTPTSPNTTGESGEVVPQCGDGKRRSRFFADCQPETIKRDFQAGSIQAGILAPISPDKLAKALDIEALRKNIRQYMAVRSVQGEVLCSLFQTGVRSFPDAILRNLRTQAFLSPEEPGRYLSLALIAIISGSAPLNAVEGVLTGIEKRLNHSLVGSQEDLDAAWRMLANYLMTARLFGARSDMPVIKHASTRLLPQGHLALSNTLKQGVLTRMVASRLLGIPVAKTRLRAMLARSKDNQGKHVLQGCQGEDCEYRAFQVVLSLDRIYDLLTPNERKDALQTILSGVESGGVFGHVRKFGMTPQALWTPSRCDFFCSVKHWTVLVTVNHLLIVAPPD